MPRFCYDENSYLCADKFKASSSPPGTSWALDCHSYLGKWKFEQEVSSLSNGIQVSYFLTWRYLKVKSSLSQANGSEGEVYKVRALKPG